MFVDGFFDLSATHLSISNRHFDLCGVLLHIELLSAPPQ
jgi:hypothetical protein